MQAYTPKNKYEKTLQDSSKKDTNFFEDYDKYLQELEAQDKFSCALKALEQSFQPDSILRRNYQRGYIEQYLLKSISSNGSAQVLYIAGVPGIGKTLCVKQVAMKVCKERQKQCKFIYVNALTVKSPQEIFKCIYYEMTKKQQDLKNALYSLNDYFEKGQDRGNFFPGDAKKKKILVVDQIDYLKTMDEQVLYNLFEWTQMKKSHLIIIAISNTLDFPQTLSPKLNSRMGNKRLPFKAYSSEDLEYILQQRVGPMDIYEEQAMVFICKKLVQCSSDIRKSLHVLRTSIYEFMLENRTKKNAKASKQLKNKKIGLQIVAAAQDRIFRDSFVTIFSQFPNSYKIVLYCLAKYFRSETRECTWRQLHHLCVPFVKVYSQLRPILLDLRDLGIIKISFKAQKSDGRVDQKFVNLKQLKEEHISLEIQYERIIYALQKENLDKIDFRMDLNF